MIKSADEYTEIIMRDEREKIVAETPTIFEDDRIERVYEFDDGAVVKYEWQAFSDKKDPNKPQFNHRFTLITPPKPNSGKFSTGVISVINY